MYYYNTDIDLSIISTCSWNVFWLLRLFILLKLFNYYYNNDYVFSILLLLLLLLGKMYYEELSRYKAEKDVHDIFHGPATPVIPSLVVSNAMSSE